MYFINTLNATRMNYKLWICELPFELRFRRLFDLADNKLVFVTEMHFLGWGVNGEAWKWRRRLFAWEEELARECAALLSNVILQVEVLDWWVWKLHSSHRYTVKSAYNNLTVANVDFGEGFNHVLWIKVIPLKVNIFIWRMLLNRIPTKDNLLRRHILSSIDIFCSTANGCIEDRDHLFFQCLVYGCLWNSVYDWLGFASTPQGKLLDLLIQFGG